MSNKKEEVKAVYVHLTKDLWAFLKSTAVKEDTSMKVLIIKAITEYKKNNKKG